VGFVISTQPTILAESRQSGEVRHSRSAPLMIDTWPILKRFSPDDLLEKLFALIRTCRYRTE